jgi:hypothetical protein
MEILEKLMDNALDFKHTRQVIFDFIEYNQETLGKRLIFNCRKSEIKEISMWELSNQEKKEKYFLTEKMIDDNIVSSFLQYTTYEKEALLLSRAYYKDDNGNIVEMYKNSLSEESNAL